MGEKSEQEILFEERTRIAQELHDSLAQSLYHLLLNIQVCQRLLLTSPQAVSQRLNSMQHLATKSLKQAREAIFNLKEEPFKGRITPVIEKYVREFSKSNGLSVHYVLKGKERALCPRLKKSLYYLLKEALSNVAKHALANQAKVKLHCQQKQVVLTVEDDGKGFDVEKAMAEAKLKGKLGLLGMSQRVQALGGNLDIESIPGAGSKVRFTIPN